MHMKQTIIKTFRCPAELIEKLTIASSHDNISSSALIRRAITHFLSRQNEKLQ